MKTIRLSLFPSCLALGLLTLVSTPAIYPAADPPPAEVSAAAEAGLPEFLDEISDAERDRFGFLPGDRLSDAALGEPFQLYTIEPEALLSAPDDVSVESLIIPTGRWFFPVVLEGRPRAILTVERIPEGWKAVTFGMSRVAREIAKVRRQWPESDGFNPKLVIVYQASAYFFTVPEKDSRNFTPLTFDGVGFGGYCQKRGAEYSATATISEMAGPLREAVEKNIRFHRKRDSAEEEKL